MKRVLSGIQPTGDLHLGNYFGMMSRMIKYQKENDLFCFIVNYHALTTIQDKKLLAENTLNAAIDSSFLSFIDKKTGNIINKNIIRQPAKMLIEVFNFIVVKLFLLTI